MRLRLLAIALLPAALQGQTLARDSTISINATRTARIPADRASFYVIVEGTAETAPDAVARVETKIKAVTDALKGAGGRVEVDRPIPYTVGAPPNPNGFPVASATSSNLARSVIRVQLWQVDRLAHVMAAGIAAGAASTSTIMFESSMADSVRRAKFAEAIAAAHADAEAMATGLGGRLGAFVDATSTGTPGFQQQSTLSFDNRFGLQQTPAPEVVVTATVTVRYRLIR